MTCPGGESCASFGALIISLSAIGALILFRMFGFDFLAEDQHEDKLDDRREEEQN